MIESETRRRPRRHPLSASCILSVGISNYRFVRYGSYDCDFEEARAFRSPGMRNLIEAHLTGLERCLEP
jgi:hypothetical protein